MQKEGQPTRNRYVEQAERDRNNSNIDRENYLSGEGEERMEAFKRVMWHRYGGLQAEYSTSILRETVDGSNAIQENLDQGNIPTVDRSGGRHKKGGKKGKKRRK